MGHQGAPNINFRHYTLKNLELAKNWPSSGPRLLRTSTYLQQAMNERIHILKEFPARGDDQELF